MKRPPKIARFLLGLLVDRIDNDSFHGDFHRIVVNWPVENNTAWTWRTPPLAAALKTDLPEIEDASRWWP